MDAPKWYRMALAFVSLTTTAMETVSDQRYAIC